MKKVAISYGHGVNTFPNTGSKGVIVNNQPYAEHTHNAEVGTRVTKILREHGIEVLELQPAFGQDVPLKNRTDKANSWGADLYYSIHGNAASPAARGWCGFYWGTSPEGKRIAQIYAAEMAAIGLPLYSGDGIHPCQRGDWTNFHELRESNMPSLLTENGFMTNLEDFKWVFQTEPNGSWDKQAVAHAKTILKYFNMTYKEPRNMKYDVPYRVVVPNTVYWQSSSLVSHYVGRGYECYVQMPKEWTMGNPEAPTDNTPAPFVINTNQQQAEWLVIELGKKGYNAIAEQR